jgi:hypothetical protein
MVSILAMASAKAGAICVWEVELNLNQEGAGMKARATQAKPAGRKIVRTWGAAVLRPYKAKMRQDGD